MPEPIANHCQSELELGPLALGSAVILEHTEFPSDGQAEWQKPVRSGRANTVSKGSLGGPKLIWGWGWGWILLTTITAIHWLCVPTCWALALSPFPQLPYCHCLQRTATQSQRTDFSPFFPSRLMEVGRMLLPLHQWPPLQKALAVFTLIPPTDLPAVASRLTLCSSRGRARREGRSFSTLKRSDWRSKQSANTIRVSFYFSSLGCYFSQSGHFFILSSPAFFLGKSHPSLPPAVSLVSVIFLPLSTVLDSLGPCPLLHPWRIFSTIIGI